MTTLVEQYPDLISDEHDELMEVVADLNAMRLAATQASLAGSRDAAIRDALAVRFEVEARSRTSRRSLPRIRFPRSLLTACVAVTTVLAGVLGYLQLRPATPVSAAQILHRSLIAMRLPRIGQVIHQLTIETSLQPPGSESKAATSASRTVTVDQWLRIATPDSADRMNLSISENGALVNHQVADGKHTWTYMPQTNTVYEGPESEVQFAETPNGIPNAKQLAFQPQNPLHARNLIEAALASHTAHALGRQYVDGRHVYIIEYTRQVTPSGRPAPRAKVGLIPVSTTVTLTVDASTYSIVHLHERGYNGEGAAIYDDDIRVGTYKILNPGQVPSHTFQFAPPAGAIHVASPPPATGKP